MQIRRPCPVPLFAEFVDLPIFLFKSETICRNRNVRAENGNRKNSKEGKMLDDHGRVEKIY